MEHILINIFKKTTPLAYNNLISFCAAKFTNSHGQKGVLPTQKYKNDLRRC